MSPFLGKSLEVIRSGHWYGNDTLWRAILDVNRIIIYCDSTGIIHNTPQRRYVAIIDGVVAGEKNGPMAAEPKKCNMIGLSFNALIGDMMISKLMGFDYKKIPSIAKGFELNEYQLTNYGSDEIRIISNYEGWNKKVVEIAKDDCFQFKPAIGWEGHIEL